jgi:hypothetical protein
MACKNGCSRRNRKNFNENITREDKKMLFSLTNPEVAILMMGVFLFAVLLGFP